MLFFCSFEDAITQLTRSKLIGPNKRALLIPHYSFIETKSEEIFERSPSPEEFVMQMYGFYESMSNDGLDVLVPSLLGTYAGTGFRDEYLTTHTNTIPRLTLDHDLELDEIESLFVDISLDYPRMLIRKIPSSHGGDSIRVFMFQERIKEPSILLEEIVIEPFIYAPYLDGHQRDYRIVFIGNEIGLFYERKARLPLLDEKRRLIESPPSLQRVLTNQRQGGLSTVLDHSRDSDILQFARHVWETYKKAEIEFRHRYGFNEGFPNIKLLGIDVMQHEDGTPVLGEVHSLPDFRDVPGVHNIGTSLMSQQSILDLYDIILLPLINDAIPGEFQSIVDKQKEFKIQIETYNTPYTIVYL